MRIAACCCVGELGVYRTWKSTSASGLIISGVDGGEITVKPGELNRFWTLLMTRFWVPTLNTWMVKVDELPMHTAPNCRPFCALTAITGPEGATKSKTPRPNEAARKTPACALRPKSVT